MRTHSGVRMIRIKVIRHPRLVGTISKRQLQDGSPALYQIKKRIITADGEVMAKELLRLSGLKRPQIIKCRSQIVVKKLLGGIVRVKVVNR